MKLAHLSEIDGDVEMLERASRLINKIGADVVAITGDVAGKVVDEKDMHYFQNLSTLFVGMRNSLYPVSQGKISTASEAAHEVLEGKVNIQGQMTSEQAREYAEDYLNFEKKSKDRLNKTYERISGILKGLSQKVVLVPGDTDGKSIDDFLAWQNIHNKSRPENLKGVSFVGYGGAVAWPPAMPIDLSIPFNPEQGYGHLTKNTSESATNVVLIHTPIRKFGESAKYEDTSRMEDYILEKDPDLVLCGHSNPFCVEDKETKTVIAGAGRLGRCQGKEDGTLTEIDVDENGFIYPRTVHRIVGAHEAYAIPLVKKEVSRKRVVKQPKYSLRDTDYSIKETYLNTKK